MGGLWARLREQGSVLWNGMSRGRRVALIAGVAGILVALAVLASRLNDSGFVPLFTHLRQEDAGEIVAVLREQGVPYRLRDQGSTILVPEARVYETRLDLATQGIPRRGVVGFEIFRDSPIGTTDFERMVRYQQALQGELTRTIRELTEVLDARVHVTLPERSPFLREQRGATASVLLHLRAPLRPHQVRGIAHLVASSVENLHPDQVTILDSTGQVLWGGGSNFASELGGHDVQARLELQRAYERELELSVQSMLEQVFGPGRAVARVRARLNFDRVEEREERFEPIVRDRGLLRSQQRLEESYQGAGPGGAGGVPGVEANIPGYVGLAGGEGRGERVEEISNYELNRSERFRIVAPGAVEGLSVAVWVDGELGPVERQRVHDAVAAALGIDPGRGDQVTVEALNFERPEPVAAAVLGDAAPRDSPWPWIALLAVSLAVVVLAGRRRAPQPTRARVDVRIADEEEEEEPAPSLTREDKARRSRQEAIYQLVREKPEQVANLLRTWLMEDER